MQVHPVPEAAGRDFPFSSLFAQLPGFSFGFGPAFACRSPEGVCSSLRQEGVKGAADYGALTHSGRGEGGVRIWDEPEAAEASVTLHQPEACRVFSLDHRTLAVVGCTGSQEGRCG